MNFLLLALLSFRISHILASRSTDAWPKNFDITKLPNFKELEKWLYKEETGNEDEEEGFSNVYIQRRIIGKRFPNGTNDYDYNVAYAPVTVFIVASGRMVHIFGYLYIVLFPISAAVLFGFSMHSMFRTTTIVTVIEEHSEEKPPRKLPVTLSYFLSDPARAPTPVLKSAPELTKTKIKENIISA